MNRKAIGASFLHWIGFTVPMRKNNCNGDIHITTFYLLFFSSLDPLAFPLKDGDVIYGRPFSLSCTWEFFIWKRGRGNKFFIDHTHSQLISSHNVAKKILKSKTIFPIQLVFSVSFLTKNMIHWTKNFVKS